MYQVQCLELGQHQIPDAIELAGSEESLMVGPSSAGNPEKKKEKVNACYYY